MSATFQNSAMVLSIGIFFSLMIVGLSAHLPAALDGGLRAHGIPAAQASTISHLPPVASLFAAFLGYNPLARLLGPTLIHYLPHAQASILTGRSFFPHLISGPFSSALSTAFEFALIACLVAAGASWLRGGKYHYHDEGDGGSDPEDSELEVTAPPGARRRAASLGSRGRSLGVGRGRFARVSG